MKLALKWIIGIGSILLGLISFATSTVSGLLFFLSAAFLIPPIFNKINSSGKISRTLKIIVPIVGIFIGFISIILSATGVFELTEYEKALEIKSSNLLNGKIEIRGTRADYNPTKFYYTVRSLVKNKSEEEIDTIIITANFYGKTGKFKGSENGLILGLKSQKEKMLKIPAKNVSYANQIILDVKKITYK